MLALEAQAALYSGGAVPSVGGGGELQLRTGLTDMIWVGLGGGLTALHEGPFRAFALGELALLFDVFRTVPFVELGAGAETYDGHSSVLLRVGAGADYLVSSSIGLGLSLRYQPALGDEVEHLFTLGLRLVWRLSD